MKKGSVGIKITGRNDKNVKIKELWRDGFFSIITAFSFAVYNGYLGLAKNYYFGFSVAVYYLLLCSVRGVSYVALKKEKQYPDENFDRYYVVSAVLLLLVNIFLIGPMILMVFQKRVVSLGSVPVVAVATYTLIKIILATRNYRKSVACSLKQSYARRAVNLADALVSLLTLQNTIIAVNGGVTANSTRALSVCSCAIVYVIIMSISVASFVRTKKAVRNE